MQLVQRLTLILLLLLPLLADARLKQMRGRVISIADGDTFTILTADNEQVKIRLHGIDCPEKGQPYGQKAKEYLSSLIFNDTVIVAPISKDRYKRIVAVVVAPKASQVNAHMIRYGYAWHYTKYEKGQFYRDLEQNARKKKLGLWADPNPIAPWEWRKRKAERPKFDIIRQLLGQHLAME